MSSEANKERVESVVTEASNHIGIQLYRLLAKEDTNVFFSPFSLSTALAMLYCGAKKETAGEMREVLLGHKAATIKDDEIKLGFGKLFDIMQSSQTDNTLKCANTVMIHKEFSAQDEFKSLLKSHFKAHVQEADFVNENAEAVELVNEWVKKKTDSVIPKLLDSLDPETVMIILNAVYFKGFWLHPFKENDINSQDFCNKGEKNNSGHQVEMMHVTGPFPYTKQESYKALQLPYKKRNLSMLILLPDSEDGLSELEKSLSSTFVQDLDKRMSSTKVEVALPKFELEYSKSLKEKFQSLGLNRVFNKGAHFDGINDSNDLFLSEVIHKAVLVVKEDEGEAKRGSIASGSPPTEEAKFIVDHPFMFAIHNKKNLILFMGRVDEL